MKHVSPRNPPQPGPDLAPHQLFLLLNLCHHLPQPHSWCSGDTEWFQYQGKKTPCVFSNALLSARNAFLQFGLFNSNFKPTSRSTSNSTSAMRKNPVCPGENSCCDTHVSLWGLLPLSPLTTVTCVCISSPHVTTLLQGGTSIVLFWIHYNISFNKDALNE